MNLRKYMSFLTKLSLLPFIIIKKNIKKYDFFLEFIVWHFFWIWTFLIF